MCNIYCISSNTFISKLRILILPSLLCMPCNSKEDMTLPKPKEPGQESFKFLMSFTTVTVAPRESQELKKGMVTFFTNILF